MFAENRSAWVAVVYPPLLPLVAPAPKYIGSGHEIMLQGFHWGSYRGGCDPSTQHQQSWYEVLRDNADCIKSAGFSFVWFPPASDSLAPEGYIPRRWSCLQSAYGTEAELRTAINALEPISALADVILNHRVGVHTAGADFDDPPFPDNHAAITLDDDSGVGTGNLDSGELYAAGRDLDHTNPGVRATIREYLQRLRNVGFKGWRYDLVKGYHGSFVAEYNDASLPVFSVGEFYDGDHRKIADWLDTTGGKSTAFDFATRYRLYDALKNDDFTRLCTESGGRMIPSGLIGDWPSRAVTFLDNHDTEYRRDEEHIRQHDGTRHFPGKTVEQGYAYLFTHPGIPCVFWSHYFDWGTETRHTIDRLIQLRKEHGIHARSSIEIRVAEPGLYAAIIDQQVAMKLGTRAWSPGPDWRVAWSGDRYTVWTRLSL